MRKWLFLIALIPTVALATPKVGSYGNPQNDLLIVSAATDTGFDFSLVAGGTDAGDTCAEGDTYCLQIDGHADATPKGFTYVDPNDDHSRIFFAERGADLQIISTIGDLGTGTANRAQKAGLPGVYAWVSGAGATSGNSASLNATGTDVQATPTGAADEFHFFKSPTGNISCVFDVGDQVNVRCDLAELNRSFTQQPNDCGEDWGDSFGVGETSKRGELLCHGDTVADPSAEVLNYGSTLSYFGIACASSKAGMTCQNNGGHGFTIARKTQSVF